MYEEILPLIKQFASHAVKKEIEGISILKIGKI